MAYTRVLDIDDEVHVKHERPIEITAGQDIEIQEPVKMVLRLNSKAGRKASLTIEADQKVVLEHVPKKRGSIRKKQARSET